jgi:Ni,Fe-hydrogenase III large subunit
VVSERRGTAEMSAEAPLLPVNGQSLEVRRPWSKLAVDEATWSDAADRLADGALTLVALWGEPELVHMALADAANLAQLRILSLACPGGRYPSVGRVHAPAIRLERAAADLFGLIPEGLADTRPWLDHGVWGVGTPLGLGTSDSRAGGDYGFLPVHAENVHQVPVGPVHAGIIEPGHFRFTADGETIVRLEERFGYTHKGLEALFRGADLDRAARLAGRCSGDSTVAYALAFSSAVEMAIGCSPPSRAVWLRALMAEMERLANHLGDVGAICNDAAFPIMLAHCSVLRERVLREAKSCFGHRMMMDCILPGGVRADIAAGSTAGITTQIANIRHEFRKLIALYDKTASLQDRTVGTGVLQLTLAQQFGAGGYVGRGSGRACDARRWPGYTPYTELTFEVPTLPQGDVNARLWIRVREVEQSIRLVEQILAKLPEGPVFTAPRATSTACEGMALVEGFRGDVFAWVRVDADGRIDRCHLRDPSWFQWPLLEVAIEGNIVADFPLCNKSFNCSYSGPDL